jgi:membrane dipeptidase
MSPGSSGQSPIFSHLLTRRAWIGRVLRPAAVLALPGTLARAGGSLPVSEEITRLFEHTISGDSLVYTEDYGSRLETVTLKAIQNSGITYAFYDVSITPNGRSFEDCMRSLTLWNDSVARNGDTVIRADCAADILAAKEAGKHAMVFLFQDAAPLDRDLNRIRLFHSLGVRIIQLTHNNRNLVGDGYLELSDGGLSKFGVQAMETMNDLRILIDLSHCGEQTTVDAIRCSRRPCAFTHAGCRALLKTDRNKTDSQIRALAERGGVIGIFNMSCWLTIRERASIDTVVDHIVHAVQIAGLDHVGFGSDGPMGGIQRLEDELESHIQFYQSTPHRGVYAGRPVHVRVPELNEPKRLLILADALSRRGFKASAIEKIIGGNFFRLFKEVVG